MATNEEILTDGLDNGILIVPGNGYQVTQMARQGGYLIKGEIKGSLTITIYSQPEVNLGSYTGGHQQQQDCHDGHERSEDGNRMWINVQDREDNRVYRILNWKVPGTLDLDDGWKVAVGHQGEEISEFEFGQGGLVKPGESGTSNTGNAQLYVSNQAGMQKALENMLRWGMNGVGIEKILDRTQEIVDHVVKLQTTTHNTDYLC